MEHRATRPKLSASALSVASHIGDTDAQRQNERHRHRARGHAAGVEGDASESPCP